MSCFQIKVVELFAGVGGFNIGLSKASQIYKTIWANQWEPSRKAQHAFECYSKHFSKEVECVNQDIALVKSKVPPHDLLVGGFPCQDYSVAATNAKGIEGKKGVLWWEIRDILEAKRPPYVLLENVDRLLKSPSKQRGRDFGIILRCFDDLGYCVQWRVINAADYGHPQKRRRVFIFACHKSTPLYKYYSSKKADEVICESGILAKSFPINTLDLKNENSFSTNISASSYATLSDVSSKFQMRFENSGFLFRGNILTQKVTPSYSGEFTLLSDVIDENVNEQFFINSDLEKWKYMKGSKRELRIKPNGEEYYYTEGAIPFPDNTNCAARTILTSESSKNRSTHVILDPEIQQLRVLTPEECEKINEFPVGWTDTGMPQKFRYFVMGNALVVGLITSIGKVLEEELNRFK